MKHYTLCWAHPNQLLNKIRLERACALLKDPYLSITTIAYSVGFASASYFCKQFKKNYQYSPKEFRDYIWGNPADLPETPNSP